jgi:ribokinase
MIGLPRHLSASLADENTPTQEVVCPASESEPQKPYPNMSHKAAVISVIGSLNVDLVTRTPRVPVAGETLTTESFNTGFGGKGANQAVACARLSRTQKQASNGEASDVEVRMVGAVGDDEFQAGFLKSLQADGLGTKGVKILKGKKTGVAVIIVETGTGENRIMFCPGANYDVQVEDLVDEDAAVVLFQLELPLQVVSRTTLRGVHVEVLYADKRLGATQHESSP